jgi:hypothetical protein
MAMAPRLMQSPASRQFILGQNLQKQSLDTSPILSNTQGFARLAQALAGGLLQRDAQTKFDEKQTADAAKLASMLTGAGVDPNLASLFTSNVQGGPQVGAALLANQQAKDLAQITANAKATKATIISGNTPDGKRLGIPEGQSAEVTTNSQGAITAIGKPFDSNQSTFPGTSSTSGAMNVLTSAATIGATDTPEYAAAYALLGKSRTITTPDGRTINEPGMDLSGFPAPTFGAQTPATQTGTPPTAPSVPVSEAPAEQPAPEAPQEPAEPSPEGVPVNDITVAADTEYVKTRLPEFRNEQAQALTNLSKLEKVINLLGQRNDLTGLAPAIGVKLGEVFGLPGVIAPSASNIKNEVESVAQESIRQLMGAQFSEKEGENVLRRAFDVSQPEAINMQRVRNLYNNLQTVLNAKRDEAQYYEKHGTLRGYKGQSPEELEALLTGGAGGQPIEPLQPGQTTIIRGVTVERVR